MIPVMGELHYARLDPADWETALRRMRAGGITIVASYVFWIHHEEVAGTFDFTDRRDLRRFVRACAQVGMPVAIRVGPWCHGEVRNGGLPDWLLSGHGTPRSNDPAYLARVRLLFSRIAHELDGLLWKDGGPVLAVQIENEFPGPSEHLLRLREIARDVGLDVPLYTITGWPTPATPLPFGVFLPLFGAYAEGFWAREITPMPGQHWRAFTFEAVRTDSEVGMDQLGVRPATDAVDTPQYPYLTCEIGGGMEQSYHRRILLDPRDTLAVVMCKLGSGSNLPGYYMYHGGTNPPGRLSTLQESQATNYWNDVPTLSYDFQAPLGQYGQVRPSFQLLRRLHHFLADFGAELFPMRPVFPIDNSALRCTLRTAGDAGFLFVSNYQRLQPMPGVEIDLHLKLHSGRDIRIPGLKVPADSSFILPVNMPLGPARVRYATAQPLCRLGDSAAVFFQVPGLPARFDLDLPPGHTLSRGTDDLLPSRDVAFSILSPGGRRFDVYLLSAEDSLIASKLDHRLVLTSALCHADATALHLETDAAHAVAVTIVPGGATQNVFPDVSPPIPVVTALHPAGPPRHIRLGSHGVAEAPTDADFSAAAVFRIDLPGDLPGGTLLRVRFTADVARVYHGEQLLNDHFFHGREFETRIPPDARCLELRLLPLDLAAPIHLHPGIRARLGTQGHVLELASVELVRPRKTSIPLD
jgi:beta-galactosidase